MSSAHPRFDRDHQFAVIGEAVIDRIRTPDGRVTAYPGGSPSNVAYGLGRLGNTVSFLTQIGTDSEGTVIREHLTSAGVDLAVVAVPRTPSATAVLGHGGAATYDFDISWTLPEVPLVGARHVHAGSIAAYLAPGADSVETMLHSARDTATVSFDPNIRPMLLPDVEDTRHRTDVLLTLSDVVKASDEDIGWLQPGRDPLAVAADWLDAGPSVVVVTLGRRGSVAVTREGVLKIPPISVEVADTVGAGDSFMAALLDGLRTAGLIGADRRDALTSAGTTRLQAVLDRAARAAAITVSRVGAEPPTSAELDGPEAQVAPSASAPRSG